MFTGIIVEMGTVREITKQHGGATISVEGPATSAGTKPGDSIAVNGVCQTVVYVRGPLFTVNAVEETLLKTTLGFLQPGTRVNLEPPLRAGDQLGGHLVQGHVDGLGVVRSLLPKANSWILEIELPERLARYVVTVGSIAIDGISLTVAAVRGTRVTISVIPHTHDHTTLGTIKPGDSVNVECDIIGKYVENMCDHRNGKVAGRVTHDLLSRWGYEP